MSIGPDGNIYVSHAASNSIVTYLPTGGSVGITFSTGTTGLFSPLRHAWTASNTLLVVNYGSTNVWQFPLTGGAGSQFCSTSPSGAGPNAIAVNPSNGDVFFGTQNSSPYYLFKVGSAGGVATPFPVPSSLINYPEQLVFDSVGNLYLTSYASGTASLSFVSIINPTTAAASVFITGLTASCGILIQNDGSMLITDYANALITKISKIVTPPASPFFNLPAISPTSSSLSCSATSTLSTKFTFGYTSIPAPLFYAFHSQIHYHLTQLVH